MNMIDRRVGKTRKAIFDALSELLQEKRYSKITVQEIIDKANVGRATFYTHFPTKDDLMINIIENFFESFNEQLNEHVHQDRENKILPVAALFTHILNFERIIKGILMSESGEIFLNRFKSYWSEKIKLILAAHFSTKQKPKIPDDILVNYIISTLIELIKFWIQDGVRYTPEQMEQYFFELIKPVLF